VQKELAKHISECKSSKWTSVDEMKHLSEKLSPLLATTDNISSQSIVRKLAKLLPQQLSLNFVESMSNKISCERKIIAANPSRLVNGRLQSRSTADVVSNVDGGTKRKLSPEDILMKEGLLNNPVKKMNPGAVVESAVRTSSGVISEVSSLSQSKGNDLLSSRSLTSQCSSSLPHGDGKNGPSRVWKPSSRAARNILEVLGDSDLSVATAATEKNKMSLLLAASSNLSAHKKLSCLVCREMPTQPCISPGCGHVCCKACWTQWLQRSKSCPMCRVAVDVDKLQFVHLQQQKATI
jgi:hypothetical protein